MRYAMSNYEKVARQCVIAWVAACILLIAPNCRAESDDDFFEARVRPVLVKHCQDCHGAKKQEGGLRLDSRDAWMRGGDRGAAIIAGEADKSLLIKAVRHDDPDLQMPPDTKKLTAAEIADLEAWVQRGAYDPRRELATPTSEKMSLEEARTFWSFQPLQAVAPPQDTTDHWSRTPLDAFVHAELKKHELSPVAAP
jgi:mono/diheme cytochrome c family protein